MDKFKPDVGTVLFVKDDGGRRRGKRPVRVAMSLAQFEIIVGNSLVLDLDTGHQLRADWKVGTATQTQTVTAAAGQVTFSPTAKGNYYLATRENAQCPWVRYGLLEVVDLVDATYERLLAELASVNERIEDSQTSLIQYQVSDPSGTAATRMTLKRLMDLRGMLEARVANYERAARGEAPVRFS